MSITNGYTHGLKYESQVWPWKEIRETQKLMEDKNNGWIQTNYNEAKQFYENMYKTEKVAETLNALQSSLATGPDWRTIISKQLDKIKSGGIYKYLQGESLKPISWNEASSLVKRWQEIIEIFEKSPNRLNESYGTIRTQYISLKRDKELLEQAIKNANPNSNIDLTKIFKESRSGKTGNSLAGSIQGTLNGMLGVNLEIAIQNLLNEKLGGLKSVNLVAAHTGGWTVNKKQIKEDLMLLEVGTKIQIGKETFTILNNGMLQAQSGELVASVDFSEADFQQLTKNDGIIGLSAKASQKSIVFQGDYNFLNAATQDEYTKQLAAFYHRGWQAKQKVSGVNPLVWQRYILSREIQRIIGSKNMFIVSGNKFVPTHQYLNHIQNLASTQLHFNPLNITSPERPIKAKKVVGGALPAANGLQI